eukprot:6704578-Prymnesium_polylepis.1
MRLAAQHQAREHVLNDWSSAFASGSKMSSISSTVSTSHDNGGSAAGGAASDADGAPAGKDRGRPPVGCFAGTARHVTTSSSFDGLAMGRSSEETTTTASFTSGSFASAALCSNSAASCATSSARADVGA